MMFGLELDVWKSLRYEHELVNISLNVRFSALTSPLTVDTHVRSVARALLIFRTSFSAVRAPRTWNEWLGREWICPLNLSWLSYNRKVGKSRVVSARWWWRRLIFRLPGPVLAIQRSARCDVWVYSAACNIYIQRTVICSSLKSLKLFIIVFVDQHRRRLTLSQCARSPSVRRIHGKFFSVAPCLNSKFSFDSISIRICCKMKSDRWLETIPKTKRRPLSLGDNVSRVKIIIIFGICDITSASKMAQWSVYLFMCAFIGSVHSVHWPLFIRSRALRPLSVVRPRVHCSGDTLCWASDLERNELGFGCEYPAIQFNLGAHTHAHMLSYV